MNNMNELAQRKVAELVAENINTAQYIFASEVEYLMKKLVKKIMSSLMN